MEQCRSRPAEIDECSGFCKSTSIFHSKRVVVPLPPNQSLDITTFISSQPHHGNIALVNAATGSRIGFPELWRSVDCVSACLSAMGICKGQVILVLSPNSVFFPVVCFSVMSLGAIVTVANPLNTAGEISRQILDSNPVLAFTTRRFVPKLSGASGSSLSVVLMDEESVSSTREFEIVRGQLDEERESSDCGVKIVGTLAEMMRREPNGVRVSNRVDQHDTAAIFYSSGTTGASKGVMLSHRNLICFVETYKLRFEPKQTTICTIPMFHIFGFATFIIGHMALGSTVVVLPKFEIQEMLSAVERYRATLVSVVPPILIAMINGADQTKTRYDLSSLKSVACGGAPLSKEVIEGFVKKYPTVNILQGYGLTESTAVAASTNTSEEGKRYGTVGLLAPRMEAKIVESDTGRVMGVNQTGELWLRGPSIMKGYFRNEEATASAIDSEGWLRTGDLCYFDSQGFIFLVDRLKELIKYKGYQVPPAELEALLHTHPGIADAAVIPFPDKEVGQYPMACVVRKAGSDISEKVVMDFVAKQVAPYKRIRKVLFLDSIPRNPSGKILRKDLMKLRTSRL